jgi:hypothetical protein
MPLKKQLASLKRFSVIVDTSSKDASRARKVSRSPKLQQEISDDRRAGLSKTFKTVRQTIADRDTLATQKSTTPKSR